MVFVKTWEDFEIAAEALLMEAPEKCRYSMKYAHSKQTLILKVTNNSKVSANISGIRHVYQMFTNLILPFSACSTRRKQCQT